MRNPIPRKIAALLVILATALVPVPAPQAARPPRDVDAAVYVDGAHKRRRRAGDPAKV